MSTINTPAILSTTPTLSRTSALSDLHPGVPHTQLASAALMPGVFHPAAASSGLPVGPLLPPSTSSMVISSADRAGYLHALPGAGGLSSFIPTGHLFNPPPPNRSSPTVSSERPSSPSARPVSQHDGDSASTKSQSPGLQARHTPPILSTNGSLGPHPSLPPTLGPHVPHLSKESHPAVTSVVSSTAGGAIRGPLPSTLHGMPPCFTPRPGEFPIKTEPGVIHDATRTGIGNIPGPPPALTSQPPITSSSTNSTQSHPTSLPRLPTPPPLTQTPGVVPAPGILLHSNHANRDIHGPPLNAQPGAMVSTQHIKQEYPDPLTRKSPHQQQLSRPRSRSRSPHRPAIQAPVSPSYYNRHSTGSPKLHSPSSKDNDSDSNRGTPSPGPEARIVDEEIFKTKHAV